MPELDDQLTVLAASIDWPRTPQLRIVRTNRLFEETSPRIVRTNPRFVLAAAAVLLIAIALAFTWVRVHTTIYRVPNPPTPSALASGSLGSNLHLGAPAISVADAQRQVPWRVTVPSSLGQPDAVYVKLATNGGPSQGEVTLVYGQRPGIKVAGETGVAVLVTEARGRVNEAFFQKMLGPDATVEEATVKGHSGYWISGHPHDFLFVGPDGNVQDDSLRLATNTLILDINGTVVRVEGELTKAQAEQIAASLA